MTFAKFAVWFCCLLFGVILPLRGDPINELPVAYEGRFRPFASYAQLMGQSPEKLWEKQFDQQNTLEAQYAKRYFTLVSNNRHPKDIERILSAEYPLNSRLQQFDGAKIVPGQKNEWYPLASLGMQTYQAKTQELRYISNFTAYDEKTFQNIRQLYLEENSAALVEALYLAYESIQNQPYQSAHAKELRYPSYGQLKAEYLYTSIPWIMGLIFMYALAGACFFLKFERTAITILIFAFISHTVLLLLRSYILLRPPVSNMYETALYVPWVGVLAGAFFYVIKSWRGTLLAAIAGAITILSILKWSRLEDSLNNVQAVLDSQYWLIIHVLMVVGSYGMFLLAAIFGHVYLFLKYYGLTTKVVHKIPFFILQSLYVGTILLVGGTILGGVWAAESWGRFWDWDPKESWAFISCCLYLLIIHAYRFRKIGSLGLAMGSIIGFLAISFTWYGVNYIMGTGMHSYGFGSGGENYYYLFIAIECLVMLFGIRLSYTSLERKTDNR